MHAKGMEVGGYDPRGVKGMALVYGCGPRGGCHHAGGYTVTAELTDPKVDRFADTGKAPIALGTRNRRAAGGRLGRHLRVSHRRHAGRDAGRGSSPRRPGSTSRPPDIYLTGERINALERVINVREGLRPEDDTLPRRLLEESVPDGPLAGQTVDFDLMRAEFYAASGLDPRTSLPTPETLERLGLDLGRRRPGGRGPDDSGGGAVSYYKDFREYLAALEGDGLLRRVRTPICKDTELMPLVRLQFRGLPAEQRTAFVFEDVTDATGRKFPGPVAVGVLGANRAVYAKALGCAPDEITERWAEVHKSYVEPRLVDGRARSWRRSTSATGCSSTTASSSSRTRSRRPGFDPAPYFTSPFWVTKDPETGERNVGTYRVMVKAAGQGRHDGPPEPAHRPPPAERAPPGQDAGGGHHRRLHASRRTLQRGQDPLRGGRVHGRRRHRRRAHRARQVPDGGPRGPGERRDRDRGLRRPHLPRAGGSVRRVHGLHGHEGGQPRLHGDRHHAPQDARLPGLPQPVPAVGEQPDPQARLRRRLPASACSRPTSPACSTYSCTRPPGATASWSSSSRRCTRRSPGRRCTRRWRSTRPSAR